VYHFGPLVVDQMDFNAPQIASRFQLLGLARRELDGPMVNHFN
jgi:hypothetical protein